MKGDLREGIVPTLLRELYVGRKSGILTFRRREQQRSVRFRKGHLIHADSNVREDRMGEVLVRHGVLTAADLERALGLSAQQGKRLGAVLLEVGLLTKDTLEDALAFHVHEILVKVFTWREGTYEFTDEDELAPLPDDLTLKVSTGELILEAARSVADPDVVRYCLGDVDRILGLPSDPLLRFQRVTLTPTDGYVLSRVDGTLSARELVAMIPLPPEEVHRSLFGLLSTAMIEYLSLPPKPRLAAEPRAARPRRPRAAETPSTPTVSEEAAPAPKTLSAQAATSIDATPAAFPAAGDTPQPELSFPPSEPLAFAPLVPLEAESLPEVVVEEAAPLEVQAPVSVGAPPVEITSVPPLAEAAAPPVDDAATSEIEATVHMGALKVPPEAAATGDPRRIEILEAYAQLKQRTHFEVLGVGREATEAQVKEAYFRLAKRFHPDVHHDPALADLRDQIEAIFVRLGEAYEVLCNPRIRASYESRLGRHDAQASIGPTPHDAATEAKLAEEAIKRGARSLAAERYWEAIQILEPAVLRASGEARRDGRLLLARAYMKNANWVKQAEELLLSVTREESDSVIAHLLLGEIYADQKLTARASAMFRKVLELSPRNEEARTLLAALAAPEAKATPQRRGLLKKLFSRG